MADNPTRPPVILSKSAPSVSLSKSGAARGMLRINLNWTARPNQPSKQSGFLKRLTASLQPPIDLDLACLYELTDGSKGVVQALGNAFGSTRKPPYIALDGDDRSGASADGENLSVNLEHADKFRRILVFAYIYEGASRFDEARGVVTVHPVSGPPIQVHLDETAGTAKSCAVALIENKDGDLVVRREVRFIAGAQDAVDRAYGWGIRWTPGRK